MSTVKRESGVPFQFPKGCRSFAVVAAFEGPSRSAQVPQLSLGSRPWTVDLTRGLNTRSSGMS